MECQNEIIGQLKVLATDVNRFEGIGWWNFEYGGYRMVFIPGNESSNTIRICVPHFGSAGRYHKERLLAAINETNREVRYVKVVILDNGSVSLNYDHKYDTSGDLRPILLHMMDTLCFAAGYLKKKNS